MSEHFDAEQSPHRRVPITIELDPLVLTWFKQNASALGISNYGALINHVLRQYVIQMGESLEETLRRVIREELRNLK